MLLHHRVETTERPQACASVEEETNSISKHLLWDVNGGLFQHRETLRIHRSLHSAALIHLRCVHLCYWE